MPVALLTGGSRGIGLATANWLATKGVELAVSARSVAALEPHREAWSGSCSTSRRPALLLAGDLSVPAVAAAWVEQTVEHFGRLDVLINNAGIVGPIGLLCDTSSAAIANNIAVNLLAPIWATQAALPALREAGGRVINVSSGAGTRAVPGWGAYCTSKAGLNNFTRMVAAEVPEVVALAFSPGMTDTDMQGDIRKSGPAGMPAGTLRPFLAAHADGRLRSVESVGKALAALAMLAGRDLNGEYVEIDAAGVGELIARFDALPEARQL